MFKSVIPSTVLFTWLISLGIYAKQLKSKIPAWIFWACLVVTVGLVVWVMWAEK
jgi:hypothetical protein